MELILKSGAKLKAKQIDFNDPKVKKLLKKVQKEIKKVEDGAKVDWEKLSRSFVTI